MQKSEAIVAEIRARGQLTIPKKIREISHLEEGDIVTILPIGESLLITPKRLELEEARRQIRRLLRSSKLTLEELLEGIKEEREDLFKEVYGAKKKKV